MGRRGTIAGGVISPTATASGAKLNSSLGGALKNTGDIFSSIGSKYGIDPALLAAIAVHETGNGTSNAVKTKNNVGGMMGKNGLMTFSSIQEGIEKMASNLKRNYIDKGLTTIEAIQRKYAPSGAANDPNGLNDYWVNGVTTYYKKFSK
ncbi:glucosaminidase domain-containing protein [Paenibacillus sp. FSL R5-0345]|uniref:glucosaminidase domain-containing protein n=1 Tax=Paenibacillus sp. FSL R5-0345 TaxID=1536770 RepID=UPI0009DE46C3|nr:glucosaminidase domain-containing protein [Paenibacillus sp. FSL R5-0345]